MPSVVFRRRSMKHVIINASCLVIICTATNVATLPHTVGVVNMGLNLEGQHGVSKNGNVQSISDIVGAGNRVDNKQQPLVLHRRSVPDRELYVNNHDKTLSPVKADYDVKDFQGKRDGRFSSKMRWKRNSSNSSTNNNFNILNLSNKNISDSTRLADEISSYTHRRSNYEINHYYNLSEINALDLSRNNLSDELPEHLQANFSILSWLDLSENNLSTIERLNFPTLEYLNVSSNRIKSFSSSHLQYLTRLDLSCNVISNSALLLPFMLRNLTDLDLSCNQLESIGRGLFLHARSLHRLDISGNAIKRLNRSIFYNLINLEYLNLAGNRIDVIENDTFSYLLNLQFLDLSHNEIGPSSIRALQGIPALIGLSLANNARLGQVMHEFVASWSLKELDASGTGLCHIPTALAQSVKSLKLANNLLNVIRSGDLDSYPLLQQLILSNNLISDIEDDALGRLELLTTLFLDRNQLTRVPISLPSNLIYLHLQNNQIYELHPNVFRNLKNLRTLNLAVNRIAYLPELPLPALLELNVRRNDLKRLSQSVVKTSPNLSDLLLENNPVKCADLLGIAEWAKPCRDEMLFEAGDMSPERDNSGNEFEIFARFVNGFGRPGGCRRDTKNVPTSVATKAVLLRSQCNAENLIKMNVSNLLRSNQTTAKHSSKDGNVSMPITPVDTTASTIGDKLLETNKGRLLNSLTTLVPLSVHHQKTITSSTGRIITKVEKKANLYVNSSATKAAMLILHPTLRSVSLDDNHRNTTISRSKKQNELHIAANDKISLFPNHTLAKNERQNDVIPGNNDKLENSSSVNKAVNSTAITPINGVTRNERDKVSGKNDRSAKDRLPKGGKKLNTIGLVQPDSVAVETGLNHKQATSTSDKLVEITARMTTTEPSSSSLSSSLTSTVEKYEHPTTTVRARTTSTAKTTAIPATTAPTMMTLAIESNDPSISNKNSSHLKSAQQTNSAAEGNLKQNFPLVTIPSPTGLQVQNANMVSSTNRAKANASQYYNVIKTRKNVNHLKMKLKFNRDQLHNDEFRDNFDTENLGLLGGNFGYAHGHTNGAHRKSKFSIYDSIYMASLKNANYNPFHHSMHVPNISRLASRTLSDEANTNEGIPATSVETSSKILPQEWNDVRPVSSGGSHYGLFIVVGTTFGMLISFGLFHLYYCRVRRGQHLHGHHHHYRQHPSDPDSSHNFTHHRYSYAFGQDDSNERLTYTISTSVLDGPTENTSSPVHQRHQQHKQHKDVLHMNMLNPLKSKPLSRNPSTSSSASSCFDMDSSASSSDLGMTRPTAASCKDDYCTNNQVYPCSNSSSSGQQHNRNTPDNHRNLPGKSTTQRDSAIDRW
ncbi:uncharacterized protein LOC129779994 [Toxorhynchites rutilus septentrionalis]|uniref:uncharacterized protein LOC129779994 n=1 Tax=Toxorhynchites rutilus septentrionalis TaxID=329112 RepID=UPI002479CD66|nr:uncharacterized protein LOC129779994 [Toxorhynchites rutilus septentrionalis]XP_055643917.1 uncharacterized protein LOC129779994 [Toxorhynchites rutilus septentrionalis]